MNRSTNLAPTDTDPNSNSNLYESYAVTSAEIFYIFELTYAIFRLKK